jgi:hypothetical protein
LCHYAIMFRVIMLSVILMFETILNVIKLRVVILSAEYRYGMAHIVILSVLVPTDVLLSVVRLVVVEP